MRPWIILIAALTYVMHMTFGCCFGHDHSVPAKPSQTRTCCVHNHLFGGHSHDKSAPANEPSQPCGDTPHNHPSHDDSCVSTVAMAAKVVVKNLLDSAPCLLAPAPIVMALPAICTAPAELCHLGNELTPHVRAHLAKSVITI